MSRYKPLVRGLCLALAVLMLTGCSGRLPSGSRNEAAPQT